MVSVVAHIIQRVGPSPIFHSSSRNAQHRSPDSHTEDTARFLVTMEAAHPKSWLLVHEITTDGECRTSDVGDSVNDWEFVENAMESKGTQTEESESPTFGLCVLSGLTENRCS